MKFPHVILLTAFGAFAGLNVAPALASTVLNLNDTVTSSATNVYAPTPANPLISNGTIDPTVTLGLSDAFNGQGQAATGVNFGSNAGTGYNTTPWNFQDDYVFSTNGAQIYTAVIALPSFTTNGVNLGVSNLQARIIYGVFSGNPVNGAPTVGAPVGGTLVDSWQNITPGGNYTVTMPVGFGPGTYILQIRGLAASSGGAYGGTIAFAPVPLPAALPLLLSGMGLLGGALKRRKVQAA